MESALHGDPPAKNARGVDPRGDDRMAATNLSRRTNRTGGALLAAGLLALASVTAGAADRMVLGEYFTSLY